MKKVVALVLTFFLLISTVTFASVSGENPCIYRPLSERQQNLLLALGVQESELSTISAERISQVLGNGNLVHPEYLSEYMPTESDMQSDSAVATEEVSQILKRLNYAITANQLTRYLKESGKSINELCRMTNSALEAEQVKITSYLESHNADSIMPFGLNNNYTYFDKTKTTPNLIYLYNTFYIHRNCLNTTYNSIATQAHYNEMYNDISCSKVIGQSLFNTTLNSASQYSYFLWGDVNTATISSGNYSTHQGIDFTTYEGAPVYHVGSGKVINIKQEYGGTSVFIYDSYLNLTFIYMHLKSISVSVNDYINHGDKIGLQGRYSSGSVSNTHVHFEVQNGQVTSAAGTGNQIVRTKSPYYYGLYYEGA